jgi:hypothetical protein
MTIVSNNTVNETTSLLKAGTIGTNSNHHTITDPTNNTVPLSQQQHHDGLVQPPQQQVLSTPSHDNHVNDNHYTITGEEEYYTHYHTHQHLPRLHHHHSTQRTRSDSHASSTGTASTTTVQLLSDIVTDVTEEIIEVLQEDINTPIKPRDSGDHSYKLSTITLAVMVFYKVSGGPFGCEPTIKAAGAFYAIIGFIVFPILWCIPEALITAELGSAYPEPSGRMY